MPDAPPASLGCCARGEEVARYVQLVLDADGTADRLAWLRRP
ncbi:hypothetical protein [Kitasatospora sp. NPDC054795]